MNSKTRVWTLVVALGFHGAANAHPGHDNEPRQRPDRAPREAPAAKETSERASSFGGGGAEAPSLGAPVNARRGARAAHGGVLVPTARGYVELLIDPAGSVSVWWLDARGAVTKPPTRALATLVVSGKPLPLTLAANGDRCAGNVKAGTRASALLVQAEVADRTTTVRARLPQLAD